MKNNYLLIDYGNSYIKAAIYDSYQDKIVETNQVVSGKKARELFSKFRYLGDRRPEIVVLAATAENSEVEPFYNDVKKLLNATVHVIGKPDFVDLLDLSNISKDVFIGADIYACAYQLNKEIKEPSMIVSLGTAYFAIVIKDSQIKSAYLLPSISKGMEAIANLTTIPIDYIPDMYDKVSGKNTKTSFAAGANLCMEGFVENVAKQNGVKPENIILTGGDCFRFANITKKYKQVKNYVLVGLASLVKEKKW